MQEIEQIYTQYRQDVSRYLCSLTRDAALAEDLLSETFLRALTGLSGFRKGACVRTWLFSIARHVWIDGLRRKRHVLSGDELLARYVEEGGPGAPPFETQVDARALAARAKELLQTRRPPERCFGCGRRDIRSRRSHRGAASAKARPARWIFARATGCGSNCRRRGQSYENTNRARDTL